MTPIERLKLVAELTALHNTAPEANEADRVKQSERIHEVRSLLTGNEDENEGKAEPLEWHEISGAKLPPPYFPCVITPAEAARSPFFKHLYDEQQRIVKEIRIEDGKAMFAVPSGTAIEKGYVGEYQKMGAIVEYAKSHELRLTEKDLNVRKILPFAVASTPESELEDVVLREGVPDDRTVKITVAGYIRAKLETLLEIPESVTDEDLYNCLTADQKLSVQFAVNQMIPADNDSDWD